MHNEKCNISWPIFGNFHFAFFIYGVFHAATSTAQYLSPNVYAACFCWRHHFRQPHPFSHLYAAPGPHTHCHAGAASAPAHYRWLLCATLLLTGWAGRVVH